MLLKQKEFCKAYTNPHAKTFGNATKAYQVTYKPDSYDSAKAAGDRLLHEEDIQKQCLLLLTANEKTKLPHLLNKLAGNYETKEIWDGKNIISIKDNPSSLEATKTCLKIYGALSNQAQSVDARQIHITLGNEQLSTVLSKLQALSDTMLGTQSQAIDTTCVTEVPSNVGVKHD